MKLLTIALQKQDYNLAAHVLVYGLIKASVKEPENPPKLRGHQKCHGSRGKRRKEG